MVDADVSSSEWQDRLVKLSDTELKSLPREKELGDLNFAEAVSKIRTIRRLVEALAQEDPEELPAAIRAQVSGQLDQVNALADQMKAFTLNQDQAATQHQSLVQQVEGQREWFATQVRPQLRGVLKDLSTKGAEAEEAARRSSIASGEIDKLLKNVRQIAGEAGANETSAFYERQAKNHGDQAKWFLVASAALALVLAVLGFVFFVAKPPPVDSSVSAGAQWIEFVRSLFIRLFFLGIVSYGLGFSVRNFRINKHLQVANEEKRNALNTYVLFAEAATTDQGRDLTTAEVVHAAFRTTDTGYLAPVQEKTVLEDQTGIAGLLRLRPPA